MNTVKDFLLSLIGGAVGAAAAITLRTLLPDWLFVGIGMVCSSVLLIEFGMWVDSMIRERRKEGRNRESQGK